MCAGFSRREQRPLSSCSARAFFALPSPVAEHGLWVPRLQELWRTGMVTPQCVGPSWTRGPTHAPSVGMGILNPWTTREV